MANFDRRLLDQLRDRIRYLHYSLQTEKACLHWVRFFIRSHGRGDKMRHPRDMGKAEVEALLTMLADERRVSPATRRQALNAALLLYRQVLDQDLPWLQSLGPPPERKRIPVVLTTGKVQSVLTLMDGVEGLLARKLYGTGKRLAEGLSLRVKEVDFDRQVMMIVRNGKGNKDRVVMLPRALVVPLRDQLMRSTALWAAAAGAIQRPPSRVRTSRMPASRRSACLCWCRPGCACRPGKFSGSRP